ncbi:hypothetical protein [Gloeobacter morelensis]|uniref:Uncharacterized protein n=1 Tax=Gloeobacter morelensis MG652769 TaxID=2781736 RepID=A0ABY3PMX5_9CYAN|nr:hypothetical protein [Gloeobacter morelensis]UFP95045.1 hypothetical protein ISF26_02005 [Gloeobacter morelensis MG652769]
MRGINPVTVCPTLAALLCCFSFAPGDAAAMSLTKIDPGFGSQARLTPTKDGDLFVAANVANFAQFTDGSVSLDYLDAPANFVRNLDTPANGEGAVLTWTVRRFGSGPATYKVHVNGNLVGTYTHSLEERYAVQEALSTGEIHAGQNSVTFFTDADASFDGELSIGDVVLHYRVAK